MKLIETNNPIVIDVIFGIVFLLLGMFLLLQRKKVVEASLLSNKVFWDKIGFHFLQNDKLTFIITNFMIPFIGIIFSLVGFMLTCNAIYRIAIMLRNLFIK